MSKNKGIDMGLAKDEEGNDRISGVKLIRVKGRILAMSRRERRNMKLKGDWK